MPLSSLRSVLDLAAAKHCAVPAFNVVDTAMLSGVLQAAEQARSPLVTQFSERTARALGPALIAAQCTELAARCTVPVVLHLDHCGDADFIEECLRHRWHSALFDASHLPYPQALAQTRRLVRRASGYPADIEGEFEHIGRVGVDDPTPHVDTARCLEFIEETGVTCFSPDIGTRHGRYDAQPLLDTDKLAKLASASGIPQVLHGASGLPKDTLTHLVSLGVAKVNLSTVLKEAHHRAVLAYARGRARTTPEPLELHQNIIESVAECAIRWIRAVGSEGSAP